jgi:predicted small lipoprotein YifL
MSKRLMFAVMTVIAGLALGACGNKGALVKPKPAATSTAPAASNPATNPPAKPDPTAIDKSHR